MLVKLTCKESILSTFYQQIFCTRVICTVWHCNFLGKRILAQKLLVNCWWNWLKHSFIKQHTHMHTHSLSLTLSPTLSLSLSISHTHENKGKKESACHTKIAFKSVHAVCHLRKMKNKIFFSIYTEAVKKSCFEFTSSIIKRCKGGWKSILTNVVNTSNLNYLSQSVFSITEAKCWSWKLSFREFVAK